MMRSECFDKDEALVCIHFLIFHIELPERAREEFKNDLFPMISLWVNPSAPMIVRPSSFILVSFIFPILRFFFYLGA